MAMICVDYFEIGNPPVALGPVNSNLWNEHLPRIVDARFFPRESIETDPHFDFAIVQIVDE